jgi:hypothetical protein
MEPEVRELGEPETPQGEQSAEGGQNWAWDSEDRERSVRERT